MGMYGTSPAPIPTNSGGPTDTRRPVYMQSGQNMAGNAVAAPRVTARNGNLNPNLKTSGGNQAYGAAQLNRGMGGMGMMGTATGRPGVSATTWNIPDQGGVVAGRSNAPAMQNGPDLAAIQAEMARRNVGAQLNANPQNSALAGYLFG
jgi:hypothetical protein